jgi:hypothetical protein
MKKFAFFLLLLSVCLNGMSQPFSKISKIVSKYQVRHGFSKRNWARYCYNIRDELYKSGKINFVDKSDTIYFLESSDIVSRCIYGKIWSRSGHLEYVAENKDRIRLNTEGVYTEYTCRLLQSWDTVSIRNEERVNPLGYNSSSICGTRLIKEKSRIRIDCILFKEFFKFERDK